MEDITLAGVSPHFKKMTWKGKCVKSKRIATAEELLEEIEVGHP